VGGSEKSRLLGGSEKNRLLNGVENGPADNVTCAVRNDHCLPEHEVLSLVRHWSMIHHALLELTPCLNQLLSHIDFFAFH